MPLARPARRALALQLSFGRTALEVRTYCAAYSTAPTGLDLERAWLDIGFGLSVALDNMS
jgi:hypothetical protein